ncbi:MAG: DNA polymerase III subunit beta [Bacteroidales bacterium]|nr:DNA polymerase III subunit beta [Bacteroidales bacterium]
MKFIINSQVLTKQVQALNGVIPNSNTVPIINGFHFNLEGNLLTIKATDLETTLVTKIALENADDNGVKNIVIPARVLMDMLKTVDDIPLTFNVNDTTLAVEISWGGGGSCRLPALAADTFPEFPVVAEPRTAVMSASGLAQAITMTQFAASGDELRPQMAGIYVELGAEHTTFVATDAHKLVRYRMLDAHSDEPASFILPKKPTLLVKNILVGLKDDCDVTIAYNNVNASFTFGDFYVVCRLVDGKYPNYDAAIPKENPNTLLVDRNSFLNVLRRVSIFANQATQQVRLDITEREVRLTAEDIELSSDAHDAIPCSYQGEPMEIGFNARFLKEMVSNLDTEEIRIELSQPNRAGIIFPVYGDAEDKKNVSILMLVMPVMLAN